MLEQDIAFGDVLPGNGAMAVMGRSGDMKMQWNPGVPAEVDAARSQFDVLKRKGYAAFKMVASGERGEQIREFDPEAARIIMAPQMQGG